MILKNKFIRKLKRALLIPDRYVPRIIINKDLAFTDEDFNARINRLTRLTNTHEQARGVAVTIS